MTCEAKLELLDETRHVTAIFPCVRKDNRRKAPSHRHEAITPIGILYWEDLDE